MDEQNNSNGHGGMRERLLRWARRYVNSHCVNIVTYHSVAPQDSPFSVGVPIRHTPHELAAHLAYLRRFYRPMSLAQVIGALEEGRTLDRAVVITFDDGFRDVLEHAVPILRRFDTPCTIFPVTSVIGNNDLIWRHKLTWLVTHGLGRKVLEAIRSEYRRAGIEPDGPAFYSDNDATINIYELARRHYHPGIIPPLMEELLRSNGWSGRELAGKYRPYLEPEDVANADPLRVDFGNHTHTHPQLSNLTAEQQREEMATARDHLQALTGRAPNAVAYPFGLRDSYDDNSVAAAYETGHRAALDLRRRINALPVSPFELSRKPAPRHDQLAFERLVEDWIAAPARTAPARPLEHLMLRREMFRGTPRPVMLSRSIGAAHEAARPVLVNHASNRGTSA